MNWLDTLTETDIQNGPLPLFPILQGSFYYPSSEFDGGVIKDCNTLGRHRGISSFIYCDFATGDDLLLEAQQYMLGYRVLGSRAVQASELIPNGWNPELPPKFNLRKYQSFQSEWRPFIRWTVFEREETRDDSHGPLRFSLLYIGGEGVATYQALYWSNGYYPKAIAIIQPGTGFGLNWTDFRNPDAPLAWVVNHNPVGRPDIVYYGGIRHSYDDFAWENFAQVRIISPYYFNGRGEVRVWEREG